MNIKKLLLTVAVGFECFYRTWLTDNEPFDATWMDAGKWKRTRL